MRPTRPSSCSATAPAATTRSGSNRCPCSRDEYRVVTWDQRGFGNSTNRNELANPRTATRDLLAILDHLEVERAHVVGQSMGGWAAMGLAVAHPDRVRSLVLADTLAGIAIDGWWNAAAAIAPRVGPFNHPALSNEFCIRNPERAHLYLADRRASAGIRSPTRRR